MKEIDDDTNREGVTHMEMEKAIQAYKQHKKYMAAYNQKPEVKAKRKVYNSVRWAAIKAAGALLKEQEANQG